MAVSMMTAQRIGGSHYLTIEQIRELFRFPSYKAAHAFLRRRRHLIQPLRGGKLLYDEQEVIAVMRGRRTVTRAWTTKGEGGISE